MVSSRTDGTSIRARSVGVLAVAVIAVTALAGCGGEAASDAAASASASAPMREAGMYRDAKLCVRNLSPTPVDVGPSLSTVGEFQTLQTNDRACFASNNTAEAAATVSLLLDDNAEILAGAENYMIGRPDFRLCQAGMADKFDCSRAAYDQYGPGSVLNEQTLSIGAEGNSVVVGAHEYRPRRLADEDYYVVYEMDVLR